MLPAIHGFWLGYIRTVPVGTMSLMHLLMKPVTDVVYSSMKSDKSRNIFQSLLEKQSSSLASASSDHLGIERVTGTFCFSFCLEMWIILICLCSCKASIVSLCRLPQECGPQALVEPCDALAPQQLPGELHCCMGPQLHWAPRGPTTAWDISFLWASSCVITHRTSSLSSVWHHQPGTEKQECLRRLENKNTFGESQENKEESQMWSSNKITILHWYNNNAGCYWF